MGGKEMAKEEEAASLSPTQGTGRNVYDLGATGPTTKGIKKDEDDDLDLGESDTVKQGDASPIFLGHLQFAMQDKNPNQIPVATDHVPKRLGEDAAFSTKTHLKKVKEDTGHTHYHLHYHESQPPPPPAQSYQLPVEDISQDSLPVKKAKLSIAQQRVSDTSARTSTLENQRDEIERQLRIARKAQLA